MPDGTATKIKELQDILDKLKTRKRKEVEKPEEPDLTPLQKRLQEGKDLFILPDEAKSLGFLEEIPEGWMAKITPPKNGETPALSYVSPEGKELSPEQIVPYKTGWEEVGGQVWDYEKQEFRPASAREVAEREMWPAEIAPEKMSPEEYLLKEEQLQQERTDLLKNIYPALFENQPETTHADITNATANMIVENPDAQLNFFENLQKRGKTAETEKLLQMFLPQITPFEISEFFSQPAMGDEFVTPEKIKSYLSGEEEVPTNPEIEEKKSLWNTFYGSLRQAGHNTSQAVLKLLSMAPRPPGLAQITPKEVMEQDRQTYSRMYTQNKVKFQDWLAKHPELEPPEEIKQFKEQVGQLPFFEQLGSYIKNPKAMAYTIAEGAPPTLAALGAFTATTALTGNPILGGMASFATFAPMQIEDVAQDLISAGADEDQAYELALPVGMLISSLDVVGEIPLLKALSPALKGLTKGLQKELVDRTMVALFKKGLVTFTTQEFTEAVTEVAQQVIQDYTVSFFDKTRDPFGNVTQTAVQTLIQVSPFALFGGGVTMLNGRSVKLADLYEQKTSEYEKVDYPTQEAKIHALNDLAKFPEAETAIKNTYDDIVEKTPEIPAAEVPEVPPEKLPPTKPPEPIAVPEKPTPVPPEVKTLTTKWENAKTRNSTLAEKDLKALEGKGYFVDDARDALNEYKGIERADFDTAEDFTDARTDAWDEFVGSLENIESIPTTEPTPTAPVAGVTPPIVPKAEVGMPEAGLQPSMIEEVAPREVRPKGKGKIVQISMDEQLALEKARGLSELEGLKEVYDTHPAKDLINLIKTSGKMKGEISNLTLRQFRELTGKEANESILTPDGQHVRWEYALDQLASEKGYESGEALREAILEAKNIKDRIEGLKERMVFVTTPSPVLPEPTTEEIATTGNKDLTPRQVERTLELFGTYVEGKTAQSAWELTQELRKETRAQRAEALKNRAEQLIVEGQPAEDAMNQAITETLAGELPAMTTDYLSDLTDRMKDVLFSRVFEVLKDEPLEMASTKTALTNALLGEPIPREPGTKGGSAFTRLQRVFGTQPKMLKAITTMASEGKSLEDVVEGIFHEIGRPPIPVDEKTAAYLRSLPAEYDKVRLGQKSDVLQFQLSEDMKNQMSGLKVADQRTLVEKIIEMRQKGLLEAPPVTRYDAPIDKVFKQKPMFNFMEKSIFNRVLKEILWAPVDIGNFLRANKASFDNSFLRQSKVLASGHPVIAWQGHTAAWQSMFSQKHAEAEWQQITRDPDFQIYEQIRIATGHDPLRVPAFAGKKGTEQWRYSEELGFISQHVERLIPRFTAWLPHIKYSERAFSAGTNEIVWGVWKQKLQFARRYSEKLASGEVKLKEGEGFDIIQEMTDEQSMLGDLIQRANLRRFSGLAPVANSFFFALRSKVGRFLLPKHLIGMTMREGKVSFNRRVMKEAWKDFLLLNAYIGGLMFLGDWLGLWETEDDPRNAEFMSARIGKTRIDPWAGYRQFVVLYARLTTGTGISSVTGAEYDVNPLGAMQSFTINSLAPLASTLLEFWTGRNFLGQVIDYSKAKYWIEKVTPFSINDVWEAYEGEGWKGATIATIPAIYGEGVQTYTGDWDENFTKLGIPKYIENTGYGITEPVYDIKDFWADTASQFKGVDPETLTVSKGYPKYIKSMVEADKFDDEMKMMPNQSLISLNADPSKGTTFEQYYRMWQDREKIVESGDEEKLKEFDKDERTRNAYLGNMSQRDYASLIYYYSITDKKKQAEYLEKHPELQTNPREEYLKSHPEDNAKLAIWGQAKLLTQAAYDKAQQLIKQFDIPDSAVAEYIPPKEIAKAYFERNNIVSQFGANSWEDKLLRVNNPELSKFLGLQPVNDSPEALELRVKNRDLQAERDALTSDEARAEFDAGHQEFVDDQRRIDAYAKGTNDVPTQQEFVDLNVEYGQAIDKFGANSAEAKLIGAGNPDFFDWLGREPVTDNVKALELQAKNRDLDPESPGYKDNSRRIEAYQNGGDDALADLWMERGQVADKIVGFNAEEKVWLADHPEIHKWALNNELLTDDGSKWNIPALRITAQYTKEDAEYDALPTDDNSRVDYLNNNEEYRKDRRRREAYQKDFPAEQVEKFVKYWELSEAGYRRERFLKDNPELTKAMGVKVPERVPSEQYDVLLEKPDKTDKDLLKMEGYKLYIPDEYINRYAGWRTVQKEGVPVDHPKDRQGNNLTWYEDDWYLLEHPAFYEDVYVKLMEYTPKQKEEKDLALSKVPTREVFDKYAQFVLLPEGKARLDARWNDRDLDAWLLLTKKVSTSIAEQRRRAAMTPREKMSEELRKWIDELEKIGR